MVHGKQLYYCQQEYSLDELGGFSGNLEEKFRREVGGTDL